MKTEKLNFKAIKNVLSRAEMKKIMAGSGGCSNQCDVGNGDDDCPAGSFCQPITCDGNPTFGCS